MRRPDSTWRPSAWQPGSTPSFDLRVMRLLCPSEASTGNGGYCPPLPSHLTEVIERMRAARIIGEIPVQVHGSNRLGTRISRQISRITDQREARPSVPRSLRGCPLGVSQLNARPGSYLRTLGDGGVTIREPSPRKDECFRATTKGNAPPSYRESTEEDNRRAPSQLLRNTSTS